MYPLYAADTICPECGGSVQPQETEDVCTSCGWVSCQMGAPLVEATYQVGKRDLYGNKIFNTSAHHDFQQDQESHFFHQPPPHKTGNLINYVYQRRVVRQLFAIDNSLPLAILFSVKAWCIERGATKQDIQTWRKKDFRYIFDQLQVGKRRAYRYNLQWVALKHYLLQRDGPSFLRLNQDFWHRFWEAYSLLAHSWVKVAPIIYKHFMRIPWLVKRLVCVMDEHYEANRWWYELHWDAIDKQNNNMWEDFLEILYENHMLTKEQYTLHKRNLFYASSSSSSSSSLLSSTSAS